MSIVGKRICITGSLDQLRNDWIKTIETQGGYFIPYVNDSVDYLVVGRNPGQSKLTKARRFNTQTITEQELHSLIASESKEPIVSTEISNVLVVNKETNTDVMGYFGTASFFENFIK
jgi:BRCT domain type II-containing protein